MDFDGLPVKRRDFLKALSVASLVLPSKSLFVPKAPFIRKISFPHGGAASGGGDAMTAFLSTLSADEWGQPSGTAATSIYFANDTSANDYVNYGSLTGTGLSGATVAADNQGSTGPVGNWIIWGSGAHDTIANRGIIGPTGLHDGYCGNEGYAFDFASLTWHRMRTPSDWNLESSDSITSISWSGGVVTFTTSTTHALGTAGVNATITGCSPSGYNGSFTLTSGSTPGSPTNTFTFNLASNPGTATVLGDVVGVCTQNTVWGPSDVLANGDETPLHTYSDLLFLPNIGTKGTLWDGGPLVPNVGAFMLDLSKCYPYQFPTTLGSPASGWTRTSDWPALPSTPACQGWDSTSNKIWIVNKQVGGGPPNNIIYDIGSDSWTTFAGVDCPSLAAGCMREGHRELWTVGPQDSSSLQYVNALSTNGGSRVAGFSPATFSQYSAISYPGFCYIPPIDKFLMIAGGNTHQLIDPATQTSSNYVTTGTALPSDFSATNGILTRLWCDTVHHCFVMALSGDSNVYVLKTSLF